MTIGMKNDTKWLANYEVLKAYIDEHHHLPPKNAPLGAKYLLNWCKYVRKTIKEGTCDEWKKEMFEGLMRESLRSIREEEGRKRLTTITMKVYLDNNVIVGIEEGDYNLSAFTSIPSLEYYYSAAHVEELIEGKDNPKISVDRRLVTISELTGTNHILNGNQDLEFFPKSIHEMYSLACSPLHTMFREYINTSTNNFNVDNDLFLDILKLKRIDVNNIKPCDIIAEIDRRMLAADDPAERVSVKEYLIRSEAIGRSLYSTLFNLLDFACFHKDKPTSHSNIARMHDASHAYYAQLCDVFVSDDKKMRYKTEAVYHYLGIKTQVMSGKDFITHNENQESLPIGR